MFINLLLMDYKCNVWEITINMNCDMFLKIWGKKRKVMFCFGNLPKYPILPIYIQLSP